jgi:N6-L-threonylcarbamoyladenine synthase
MLSLGIESTAHTFGIGIVSDKGKVLANLWDTYRPPLGWGIKPMDAAQHHREVRDRLLKEALSRAGKTLDDIGLVAFSQGPGLPPCLHRGLEFSKSLSNKDRPLIGVNHCIAHIEIGRLKCRQKDPVVLYVSGANTQILSLVEGRYRCFGETMDVGIGNALDKFGRDIGLGFPAGPRIESLARGGRYHELPYTVKGMDLSFSGIVTEAVRRVKSGQSRKDMCFSLQETLFAMLTEVTERALAHTRKGEVLLTGGVAANSRLQEMLGIMCRERGARFAVVPRELAGDNGSMIAWTGLLMHKSGMKTRPGILPRQRTDDVDVRWL